MHDPPHERHASPVATASLVPMSDIGKPGSNVSAANLPARLVKANGSVKRAFYM